ncbi:MAG TPA: hypothetical protein DIT07_05410 [Sphingobacteriaceae bacterium]|nr:hypothetical protein [Sphingobacteriaceae bacterium]
MAKNHSDNIVNSSVSVVMATYNGGKFLEEQISSILQQDLSASEIIVCDDCSDDDTPVILKSYAEKGKLKYHANSQRLGVIDNFKRAASFACKDNYIAFSDQDDIWLPEKLKLSMHYLQENEKSGGPCLVYSDPQVINRSGDKISDSLWNILGYDQYEHNLETIIYVNPAGGCTMLINPELAAYVNTIPSDCYMHDAWLTLCAYTFGHAAIVPGPLIKYRQHENNVTFSTAYRSKGRIARILNEIAESLNGGSNILKKQFILIRQFYECFYQDIDASKKSLFERFLALEGKSYLTQKIAIRKALKR